MRLDNYDRFAGIEFQHNILSQVRKSAKKKPGRNRAFKHSDVTSVRKTQSIENSCNVTGSGFGVPKLYAPLGPELSAGLPDIVT